MKKFLIFFILFLSFAQGIYSSDVKYTYSVMPSKIFIGDNYLTHLTVSNLYKNIYVDMKLSEKLDEDIFYEVMKLAIYYVSLSKEVRFEFSGIFEKNLVIAFSIRESAFRKAKYFILLSTNYDIEKNSITEDLKNSYCRWYYPVLGEFISANSSSYIDYNSYGEENYAKDFYEEDTYIENRVNSFYNRLKNEKLLMRDFGWIYSARW